MKWGLLVYIPVWIHSWPPSESWFKDDLKLLGDQNHTVYRRLQAGQGRTLWETHIEAVKDARKEHEKLLMCKLFTKTVSTSCKDSVFSEYVNCNK